MKIGKQEIIEMLDGAVYENGSGAKTFFSKEENRFVYTNGSLVEPIVYIWMKDDWHKVEQPKMRKANRNEWLSWACSADALGWVVCLYGEVGSPQHFGYRGNIEESYKRARMTPTGPGEWEDFMVEDVE